MSFSFDSSNSLDLCGTEPLNEVLRQNGFTPMKIPYSSGELGKAIQKMGADGFLVGNDGKGIPFDNKFSTGGYDTILFELWSKWNPNKIDVKSRTLGWGYTTNSTLINYVAYQKRFKDMLQEYKRNEKDWNVRKKLFWEKVKEKTQNPKDLFSWAVVINVDRLKNEVDDILVKIGGTSDISENKELEKMCFDAKSVFSTTTKKTIEKDLNKYGVDYSKILFWKNPKYISVELTFDKSYIVNTFEKTCCYILEI